MPTKLPRVIATLPKEVYKDLKKRSAKDKKSISRIIVLALLSFLATGCSKSDKPASAQEPGTFPGQGITLCPHVCVNNGPCGC